MILSYFTSNCVRWTQINIMSDEKQRSDRSTFYVYVPDPFPPENPQNARTGNQTVNTDGTVNVLVLWDAPRESDLVVHHYKVTWSTQGTPTSSQSRAGRVTDGVRCHELGLLFHLSAGGFFQILCMLLYPAKMWTCRGLLSVIMDVEISEELKRKWIQTEDVDDGCLKRSFQLSLIKLNLNSQRSKKFPQVVLVGFSLGVSGPGSAKSMTDFKDLDIYFHRFTASLPFGYGCLAGVGLMCTTCDVVKNWSPFLLKDTAALAISIFYCSPSTLFKTTALKHFWLGHLFLQCNNLRAWESNLLYWTVAYNDKLFFWFWVRIASRV